MTPRNLGLVLLMATAVNWGATWPIMKFLLTEMPPLTMRALGSGMLAVLLLLGAFAFRVPLHVPHEQRPRLVLFSLLNITAWMAFGTLALRWLTASEAAILAYTMPVWAALFAWPILGERPGPARIAGLILGFGSIVILFAGRGVELGLEKLPGLGFILASALFFALGAVLFFARTAKGPLDDAEGPTREALDATRLSLAASSDPLDRVLHLALDPDRSARPDGALALVDRLLDPSA